MKYHGHGCITYTIRLLKGINNDFKYKIFCIRYYLSFKYSQKIKFQSFFAAYLHEIFSHFIVRELSNFQ